MIGEYRPLRDRIREFVKIMKQKFKLREESIIDEEQKELCRCLIKHFQLIKNEPERTQELYLEILTHYSYNIFSRFITDCNQENLLGRAIAEHNLRIEEEIAAAGINFQSWFRYRGWSQWELVEFDRDKIQELWAELEISLLELEVCFKKEKELQRSIRKDIVNIQKNKAAIQHGLMRVPETGRSPFFVIYNKSVEYLKKKHKLVCVDEKHIAIFLKVHMILAEFSGQWLVRKYHVQLWEREPLDDLLQGNYSNCCIAVGDPRIFPDPKFRLPGVHYKKYPAGITEYLIDKGIQVARVIDDRFGVVGQCWLFLSKNEIGTADLITDSFDLNYNKVISKKQKQVIRSCMFRFLKKYAEAIGARRVLLAKNGQTMSDGKRRSIIIDVEVDDLPTVSVESHIEKIGGYFMNEPYFLESRFGDEAFLIWEKQ